VKFLVLGSDESKECEAEGVSSSAFQDPNGSNLPFTAAPPLVLTEPSVCREPTQRSRGLLPLHF